ncbi:MAG: DUF4332 domain-containing protein [Pseudomonadota bacterium]
MNLSTTLLFRLLRATHARGTHHKLALDALLHLRGPGRDAWRRLFLSHAELYLEGAKAPDREFKDFTNHVLHVRDGYWGGAAEKAMRWYDHVVDALVAGDFPRAVYAAGVLSHYYTDPIMPFHTAQSDAENTIHRAVEWSVSKSYDALMAQMRRDFPMPDVPIEDRVDWLADLVCDGAELSNTFYERLIANYDFDRGVVDPPAGLNGRSSRFMAQLIAYAQVGQARILDRAFADAGVAPPEVSLTAKTVVAGLQIPIKWVLRRMDDAADRQAVEAIYDELQSTGGVERTLPEDERVVRDGFRRQVGEVSATARPEFRPPHRDGVFDYASALNARVPKVNEDADADASDVVAAETHHPASARASVTEAKADMAKAADAAKPSAQTTSTPLEDDDPVAQLRARAKEMSAADEAGISDKAAAADRPAGPFTYRLAIDDDVEDGPSVGPKTALRLNKIGIVTVRDLLEADPSETADALDVGYITPALVADWQTQAQLQCEVPELTGTASQLAVGAGVRTCRALAEMDADDLHALVRAFAETSEGTRLLRDRPAPARKKIARWIANARATIAHEDRAIDTTAGRDRSAA